MVNGLHLYSAFFVTNGHPMRFTLLPHNHQFKHTFTPRRRCQSSKAPASSSGDIRSVVKSMHSNRQTNYVIFP